MKTVVTTNRWRNDPESRGLVEYLEANTAELGLEDAVLYYDFPAYADYEAAVWRPDLLLFSPTIGFVAIRNYNETLFQRSPESILEIDLALGDFTSNLHSRLVKSRALRRTRTTTVVDIHAIVLAPNVNDIPAEIKEKLESELLTSFQALSDYISGIQAERFSDKIVEEIRSVVEGAKALSRVSKRVVKNPETQPLALMLSKIEQEIANFDEKQRSIALIDVGGPARIRGLAGSGKTVILAMKAAHLHLNSPDQLILFTFLTKSLRATIKTLITKFYRQYSDSDPDWEKIHIRHSWGGRSVSGVYSDACFRAGVSPITYGQARGIASRRRMTPFEAICAELIENTNIDAYYDHVLIDEGQDFPASFYKLALSLTKGERDRQSIVWAYDELQDIMNVKIRPPSELFGHDKRGDTLVDLDRSSAHLPRGATNDAVLSKAYRNQRDVLVSAHALGFGVYSSLVQMLESAAHWEDVGYVVNTGDLVTGERVEIERPDVNSPQNIPSSKEYPLIKTKLVDDLLSEAEWVANEIKSFIDLGVEPEEILVISMDDRSAKSYLRSVGEQLAQLGISSNNIIADPYNEPPFSILGKVTLSTVYRAKGNEAALVFAMGVDALRPQTRGGRNKLFTAFTRTKAWLRVSGITHKLGVAEQLLAELEKAVKNSPSLNFTMPDLDEIETIQRGFSKKATAARKARKLYVESLRKAGLSDEEIAEELQRETEGG